MKPTRHTVHAAGHCSVIAINHVGYKWMRGVSFKKLWCCVGGRVKKKILLYQLSWQCELATVKILKADVSSVSHSSLSTQLIKPNYYVGYSRSCCLAILQLFEMSPSVRRKRSLGAWSPSAEPENILLYLRSNVHKLVLQLIDSRTL